MPPESGMPPPCRAFCFHVTTTAHAANGRRVAVLRPCGCFAVSFSDRMFRSKGTSLWRDSSVAEWLWIVAAFFVYSGVVWRDLSVLDLSPADGDTGDPLFVVQAFKSRS